MVDKEKQIPKDKVRKNGRRKEKLTQELLFKFRLEDEMEVTQAVAMRCGDSSWPSYSSRFGSEHENKNPE